MQLSFYQHKRKKGFYAAVKVENKDDAALVNKDLASKGSPLKAVEGKVVHYDAANILGLTTPVSVE